MKLWRALLAIAFCAGTLCSHSGCNQKQAEHSSAVNDSYNSLLHLAGLSDLASSFKWGYLTVVLLVGVLKSQHLTWHLAEWHRHMCRLSAMNNGCLLAGVSGSVSLNGQPLTAVTMQRLCGYVLQDDVLPGTSTVEEYLR